MKRFWILLSAISLNIQAHDCQFEGNKWMGQRRFNQACQKNLEQVKCPLSVQSGEQIHEALETCQCLMEHSNFVQQHNKLIHYRSGAKVPDMKQDMSLIAKRKFARKQLQQLCKPFKAIEILQGDQKYYAIYEYNERLERCFWVTSKSNYSSFSSKFNFPGAFNWTAAFSNIPQLGAAHLGYMGPFDVAHIDDEDVRKGMLNCTGTYSELIERVNAADADGDRSVPSKATSPEPNSTKPLPNQARPN